MGLSFGKSRKLQRLDMSNNKIGKLKAQLFNKAQTRYLILRNGDKLLYAK